MSDRILREAECKAATGLGRTTRYELEQRGEFPRRVRLTGNRCGWRESEILAWIRSRQPVAPAA